MKNLPFQKRTLALIAVLVPLFALFVYVALRSGPFAPVPVTLAPVENRSLSPALFGIGNVEARHTYKIGPIFAGRLKRLDVDAGDRVKAGQLIGEMDPVDLDERIRAQAAVVKKAQAQLVEAQARKDYAKTQADRYEDLFKVRSVSEEAAAARQQDLLVGEAGLTVARAELARLRAEGEALEAQRNSLRLIAPADGLVVTRGADPGTTIVAGQAVVELIDPVALWVNVRFDQIHARGLAAGLPAKITLRSQEGEFQQGRVLRVEALGDVVTEEILAKVIFDQLPSPPPPVGELAEVTVELPPTPPGPAIPNAAIRLRDGRLGVWKVETGKLNFTPVLAGISDLSGQVLITEGLIAGDQVVVYTEKALHTRSRIRIVDRLSEDEP